MAEDLKSQAAELMKKVLTVGVGTFFLTEESLRGMVSEFKLPKELLGGVLESANKSRKEFMANLSHDLMSRVMEKVDPNALIREIMENSEFEVRVRLRPKQKDSESE